MPTVVHVLAQPRYVLEESLVKCVPSWSTVGPFFDPKNSSSPVSKNLRKTLDVGTPIQMPDSNNVKKQIRKRGRRCGPLR